MDNMYKIWNEINIVSPKVEYYHWRNLMFSFLITIRCKTEGLIFNNVKIDLASRFNRQRLFIGIRNIRGSKSYPVRIMRSSLNGNISIGIGVNILRTDLNTSKRGSILVGRFTSINGTEISAGHGAVNIGSFCSIANGTRFLTSGHNMNRATTYYVFKHVFKEINNEEIVAKGDIFVGDDVWIGANSIIMGGVSIGRGSVIAAGSIVTKDVVPYSIVGGNPAKIIKMRFANDVIDNLEKSNWWDWDIETIKDRKRFFETNLNISDISRESTKLEVNQ